MLPSETYETNRRSKMKRKEMSVNFIKAYKNFDFLSSHDARTLRILSEYLEPEARFKKHSIESTIVFFGSARSMAKAEAEKNYQKVLKEYQSRKNPGRKLKNQLMAAKGILKMVPYYEAACRLSEKLTNWTKKQKDSKKHLVIASGGGDGMMCAANKGAIKAKGKSIGLNISLPFEQYPNSYITPELSFEFHYFFMRKFWFIYLAKAIVVFPGGFGTMDEFMEALTLIQTKKMTKPLPIVLFGKKFWSEIINFKKLVEWGVIAAEDLNLFLLTDSVDEAFDYLTLRIKKRS